MAHLRAYALVGTSFLFLLCHSCGMGEQEQSKRQGRQAHYFDGKNPSYAQSSKVETSSKTDQDEGQEPVVVAGASTLDHYKSLAKTLKSLREQMESADAGLTPPEELAELELLHQQKTQELESLESSLLEAENINQTISELVELIGELNLQAEALDQTMVPSSEMEEVNAKLQKLQNESDKLSWQEILNIVFSILRLVLSIIQFIS